MRTDYIHETNEVIGFTVSKLGEALARKEEECRQLRRLISHLQMVGRSGDSIPGAGDDPIPGFLTEPREQPGD